MPEVNTVLFDLDGTLVDTAPDMAGALNILLQRHKKDILPLANIRNTVSKGGSALVRLGFGNEIEEQSRLDLLQQFLEIYAGSLCSESRLFSGMDSLLDLLEQNCISWGIVTNKPGWLTEPLLTKLNLMDRAACVVSGDTLSQRKPDPEPLLYACKRIRCKPEHSVYIGDDERDIVAGNAAGMRTLVAQYGYIPNDEDPQSWGATGIISSVDEIKLWLNAVNH